MKIKFIHPKFAHWYKEPKYWHDGIVSIIDGVEWVYSHIHEPMKLSEFTLKENYYISGTRIMTKPKKRKIKKKYRYANKNIKNK
jgi:hypothetical protein